MCLNSLFSPSFTSSELDSSIFFDERDVDKTYFIDSFENTISCQSHSSKDDSYLFESKSLSFFKDLFCQNLSSIWCAFFASFISEFSCSSSECLISVGIYQGKDGIVVRSLNMKYSTIQFKILFFLWSSGFCFCSCWCSHNLVNNDK